MSNLRVKGPFNVVLMIIHSRVQCFWPLYNRMMVKPVLWSFCEILKCVHNISFNCTMYNISNKGLLLTLGMITLTCSSRTYYYTFLFLVMFNVISVHVNHTDARSNIV